MRDKDLARMGLGLRTLKQNHMLARCLKAETRVPGAKGDRCQWPINNRPEPLTGQIIDKGDANFTMGAFRANF